MVFANLPTRLGEVLKDRFTPFYNEFCAFEENEGDDKTIHSNHSDEISDSEQNQRGKKVGKKKALKKRTWNRKKKHKP